MRPHLPLVAALAACTPPELALFNTLTVDVAPDQASANAPFIAAIDSATTSLHVALPAGDDTSVSDAILAAVDRGVEVEVIADIDTRTAPAVAALLDAEVPTTLADDEVAYFDFNINAEVRFPSEDCVMSHAWVVADRARIVTGSSFGGLSSSPEIVYSLTGEEIVEDILWEHNQVYGGVDATTVTAYDANAKSLTEPRWAYHFPQPIQGELYFGPQERLMKRVIDAVYSARSSVRLMSPTFANPELAKALQDKAKWGIAVEVVVGPDFNPDDPDVRTWFYAASDVAWSRSPDPTFPTVALIDIEPDALGFINMPRAMTLTHGFLSGARLYRSEPTPSDQLVDGTMWVVGQTIAPGAELQPLIDLFDDRSSASEAL